MKNKIKLMKSGPEVTDEEIKSFMDFDALLTKNTLASIQRKQRTIIKSIVLGLTLAVGVLAVWIFSPGNQEDIKSDQNPLKKMISPSSPEVMTDENTDSARQLTEKPSTSGDKDKKLSVQKSGSAQEEIKKIEDKKTGEKEKALPENHPVYVQAEPVEGYPVLYEYFARELIYPKEAIADSAQGVVTVVFTINKSGKPEKISIEQSLGKAFDKEATRLIENMPPWKPATYNQKPVNSRMSLPLTFQIREIKNQD